MPALEHAGPTIAFVDLQAQRKALNGRVETAIATVLDHGRFIMGPEVRQLESELADFCGAKHALTCASGTDALLLALMAWGVGAGDAVFVPTFTFASTAEVVVLTGATPVFVDVHPDTFNLAPESLAAALATVKEKGLRPAAVIPVDLFGQPAEYDSVYRAIEGTGMKVLSDAAQSFGANGPDGRNAGTYGDLAATSFFPAKPLGCYGDGGAVFCNDDETISVLRSLRVHGQGADKYDNVRIGINGRLDTMQAAVLIEKLSIFRSEIEARQQVAAIYDEGLSDVVKVPGVLPGATSAWAQYTITTDERDRLAGHLKENGVPTAVYYPRPLHLQTAYKGFPRAHDELTTSEWLAQRVLSLPMHPYLELGTQEWIIGAIRNFFR